MSTASKINYELLLLKLLPFWQAIQFNETGFNNKKDILPVNNAVVACSQTV
jgi:hypothetical protein